MKKTDLDPQMDADKHRFNISNLKLICVYLCSSVVISLLFGCIDKSSQANIDLRRQVQSKDSEIQSLKRTHDADQATIHSLEQRNGGGVSTLSQDRLDQLFTTHGLTLGKLTGGADLDPQKPGDDGIKVYATPIDDEGEPLKAAGAFVVELFDLAKASDNRIGHWEFSAAQARQSWFGKAFLYEYVLSCPWQNGQPAHSELTVKVTFHDELTQREFVAQKVIRVHVVASSNAG